ncbi:MAG: hypothetical protein DSY42_06705, partial [Aquifex sp.]
MCLYPYLWKNQSKGVKKNNERGTGGEEVIILPSSEREEDVIILLRASLEKESKEEEIKKLFENVEPEEPEFCPYCGQELECSDGFVRCWDCGIIFHECEKTIDEQLEDCLEEG